jgi:DNA-binding protein YbaB
LLVSRTNAAAAKVRETSKEKMSGVMGGLGGLPGMPGMF